MAPVLPSIQRGSAVVKVTAAVRPTGAFPNTPAGAPLAQGTHQELGEQQSQRQNPALNGGDHCTAGHRQPTVSRSPSASIMSNRSKIHQSPQTLVPSNGIAGGVRSLQAAP